MELSLFLAQLFGLSMIIFVTIVLFRPNIIDSMIKDLKNPSLAVVMTSFVTVIAGLAVVLSHNIWEFSWVGLVTLFGWAALIKGILFIACPDTLIGASDKVLQGSKRKGMLIIALLAGCYFAYKGFGY